MTELLPAVRMGSALAALAVARGGLLDDAQAVVYLRLLQGADPGLVERACEAIAREPRPEFDPLMPAVGAILERARTIHAEDAKVAARAKLLPLPKSEDDEPRYFCLDCHDESSGWRELNCPEDRCGRHERHYAHSYVVRCHCWQRNPVVAERRKRFENRKTA
jgi:hypothetical protein